MTTTDDARSQSVADTAFSIAVVRAEETKRPEAERLFEDPYAHLFAAAGAHAAESTQRFLELPFFHEGVRLRTRFIDDAVKGGLAGGLQQVVLLGAGFDARGLRMPEIAAHHARVFEVDGDSQLARKRAVLDAAGIALPEHVVYVPTDFDMTTLGDALEAKGFRRGGGAMFVWEGVIGYIGADEIDASLRFMATIGGARSRVVFTYAEMSFDPEGVAARTQRAGFHAVEEFTGDALWRRYLPGDPHPVAHVTRLGLATV